MALSTRSNNLYTPIGIIGTGRLERLNDPNKAFIQPLSSIYSVFYDFYAILFTQNAQLQRRFFRHIFLTKERTFDNFGVPFKQTTREVQGDCKEECGVL